MTLPAPIPAKLAGITQWDLKPSLPWSYGHWSCMDWFPEEGEPSGQSPASKWCNPTFGGIFRPLLFIFGPCPSFESCSWCCNGVACEIWWPSEMVGIGGRAVHAPPPAAARPASPGGLVWPNNFYFRLRTCRCVLRIILIKFGNLYSYFSVRNRTAKISEYRVTVRWLPNLVKILR